MNNVTRKAKQAEIMFQRLVEQMGNANSIKIKREENKQEVPEWL
jgi:putative transposon-encoded protein